MLFGKKRLPVIGPSEEFLTEHLLSGEVKTTSSFVRSLFRASEWREPGGAMTRIMLILVNLVERVEALESKR